MLRASDLMTKAPVTVRVTATVRKAVELLQTMDVRHLPVVDDGGTLVGMISDRDLRAVSVPCLVPDEYVANLEVALAARVSTLMSGDVVSVDTEADAAEVIDLMLDHKVGALPVIDADGSLVGIISYVDVLRKLSLESGAAE